jgi:DNA polymerase III delta prime subunit
MTRNKTMSHSYFITGETEEGIQSAERFIETERGMVVAGNSDVLTLRHSLLSVDDARKLRSLAELSPNNGDQKVLIISASRLFHEAQNALLKLFEEPPAGTLLILVIPSEGILLPTLRSRLLPLPMSNEKKTSQHVSTEAQEFLKLGKAEREKFVTKILDRAKSDKDEEKQAARLAATHLIEGLTHVAHEKWQTEKSPAKQNELQLLLEDLNAFLPILHERSAPLKLIFEHLLLVSTI